MEDRPEDGLEVGPEGKVEDGPEKEPEEKAMGALEVDLVNLPSGARALIAQRRAQRRAQGLRLRERIYELHVGQGLPLLEVARMLGVSLKLVSYHWCKLQKQIIDFAPRSPDDFAALRERIAMLLWQTIRLTGPASEVEESCFALVASSTAARASSFILQDAEDIPGAGAAGRKQAAADGKAGARAAAPAGMAVPAAAPALSGPLLTIHLRALEQLTRLYGLGRDNCVPPDAAQQPYATPEEIAAAARERMLELHDRSE